MAEENYCIFPAGEEASFLFSKKYKTFTPTEEEVKQAKILIENFLNNRPEIQELKNYKTQYFGFINELNEKNIFANYFCDSMGQDWRKQILLVFDGGNCFFNIKANLNKKEVYDLQVNGEA